MGDQKDLGPSEPEVVASAKKFDGGKLRFSLIPPDVLRELALVYTIGALKYGDDNYLNGGGLAWRRVIDALHRHLNDWLLGEERDLQDGQHHLASVMWCAATLMLYQERMIGEDDRDVRAAEVNQEAITNALASMKWLRS